MILVEVALHMMTGVKLTSFVEVRSHMLEMQGGQI